MGKYEFWIDWFRSVPLKPSGAPQARPTGAPAIDPGRLRRVLNGGRVGAIARDFGLLKSLSPAQRMINWLKTQPAEIVDAAAQTLNWSQAEEVVLWLLKQPTTDAATAVKLFMRSEPAFYVEGKAGNPSYDADSFDENVILTFASNWTANRYARGGVGYDPRELSEFGTSDMFYISELIETMDQCGSKGAYPIPNLPGLAGPFQGPRPKQLETYLKERGRGELFFVRYLYAGLGTWILDDDINEQDFDEWIRMNGLDGA